MNNPGQLPPETRRERVRLDRAVRRSVRLRAELPSLRAMLRACAVYANVIAAVVALGLPSARQVAGSFESALRTARESASALPDLLAAPADLSEVTETVMSEPAAISGHAPESQVSPAADDAVATSGDNPTEPVRELPFTAE